MHSTWEPIWIDCCSFFSLSHYSSSSQRFSTAPHSYPFFLFFALCSYETDSCLRARPLRVPQFEMLLPRHSTTVSSWILGLRLPAQKHSLPRICNKIRLSTSYHAPESVCFHLLTCYLFLSLELNLWEARALVVSYSVTPESRQCSAYCRN